MRARTRDTRKDPVRPIEKNEKNLMGIGDEEGDEPAAESGAVAEGIQRVRIPVKPSEEEVKTHLDHGHIPFRDWCDMCVEGRADNPGHFRQTRDGQTIPTVSFDYFWMKEEDKDEAGENPLVALRDRFSKWVGAFVAKRKGAE